MLQQLHNLQPSRWSIVDMRCAEGYHQNDAVNRFADVNLSSVCMLCLVCLAWVVTWWTWQESCIKDRTKVTRRRFTIHYTKSIQLQYLYIHRLTSCLTCLFDDSIIYHLLYIDSSLCCVVWWSQTLPPFSKQRMCIVAISVVDGTVSDIAGRWSKYVQNGAEVLHEEPSVFIWCDLR